MGESSRKLKPARYRSIGLGLALVGLAAEAQAHHSFAAVYDQQKPVRVEGIVERLEVRNPHAVLAVTSKESDGTDVVWTFEMGAPRVLERFGLSAAKVKAGDRIVVEGALARRGGHDAAAQYVTTASGERLQVLLPIR